MGIPLDARLCDNRDMKAFNSFRRWRATASAAILALGPAVPALEAQDYRGDGFASYMQLLSARARGEGVHESTVAAMTAGLSYNPRVIELDRAQPGNTSTAPSSFTAFEPY